MRGGAQLFSPPPHCYFFLPRLSYALSPSFLCPLPRRLRERVRVRVPSAARAAFLISRPVKPLALTKPFAQICLRRRATTLNSILLACKMESENGADRNATRAYTYQANRDRRLSKHWAAGFVVNVAITIFTMIAALGVWAQYGTLDQTLQETRADFRASERPYVSMGRKDGSVGNFIVPSSPQKGGIAFYFHNSGHLPALRFNVQPFDGTHSELHMARIQDVKTGKIRLLSGEKDILGDSDSVAIYDKSVPPEMLKLIKSGQHPFSVKGMFEYCDDFGLYVCSYFETQYIADPLWAFNLIRLRECRYKNPPNSYLSPDEQFVRPCETPEEHEEHDQEIQNSLTPPS